MATVNLFLFQILFPAFEMAVVKPEKFQTFMLIYLQVITNKDTRETLLCIAYVFEVSTSEHGAQHHIYRLVKD